MNIFKWFKPKSKTISVIEEQEFVFETSESAHIGDLYTYKVKAKSKEEAFNKLVQYFFGKNMNQDIKSSHNTFSYPNNATFNYKNMPFWFAKRINGSVRDKNYDYQQKLEDYCKQNNIELKD